MNEEGCLQSLEGHDNGNRLWLSERPKPENFDQFFVIPGSHCLKLKIKSKDWDSNKDEAFESLNEFLVKDYQLPEKIQQLKAIVIQELNLLARGALAIAREKELQKEENQKNQPWFEQVLCNKDLYPSAELKLMAVN